MLTNRLSNFALSQIKERPVHRDQILPLVTLIAVAFGGNVPLGFFRESSKKFSLRWFVLVHFSIPFIIVLRNIFGFSWRWIPVTLGCAVAGQLLGGFINRRTNR